MADIRDQEELGWRWTPAGAGVGDATAGSVVGALALLRVPGVSIRCAALRR